jgi:integrase/recombinase XerD
LPDGEKKPACVGVGGEAIANQTGRWLAHVAHQPEGLAWLRIQRDLGLAPRTLDAYGRALADYLDVCGREHIDVLSANRGDIARYVRDLTSRPNPRGANIVSIDSRVGLANATLQQRLVAVRLFYDYLVEEGIRETNPVGRGRYTPGKAFGGHRERSLIPRFTKLPWIPTDEEWETVLGAARAEPLRNRLMLSLGYDAALRREELCLLRTDDIDPAHRTIRVRPETSKSRRERIVPYSVSTGTLLRSYFAQRRTMNIARGPLFLSESSRNRGQPISPWTWSKVVRALALRADLPRFSTHTLRHLCLTDLARCGWELHAIAQFAGHRSTETTLQYIHLSGRDLAIRLRQSMSHIHADRVLQLAADQPGAREP